MTDLRSSPVLSRYGDRLVALSAALLSMVVYLMTIYPGLFGLGDAAKFAFVGKILGTPHAPGYPLYVMVSHLFSYIPVGTLAYRMNLLSALFAAVAVAIVYFAGRVLGLERPVALATSLALGFGHAFWSKALYAKGYTLNAALVAAGFLLLLKWGQSRERRHLYAAIAIFALSSGNHLIVIALVPALLLFVIATEPRTALSVRTLLITAGMIAAGLSQYLFVLIRTRQNAPYLEARATTLRELLDVMLARRWAHEIGAYASADLLHARIPLVTGLVTTELTMAGLVLAAVGLFVLVRRRRREATLLLLSAAGVIALTANMSSNEDEGFLLPAFVALWLLAGCGLQWVFAMVRDMWARHGSRPSWGVTAGTLLAVAALPVSLVAGNFRTNDHHARTFEIRYFNSLFEMLPDKSALVEDRYILNMMVKYKLLGEQAAGSRQIDVATPTYESVSDKMRQGYRIFAFSEGRVKLGTLGYEFEPVQLYDVSLPAFLDVIGRNWTVAIAATPDVAAQLRANRAGWKGLGVSDSAIFEQKVGTPLALVGVNGASGQAIQSAGFPEARASVALNAPIGTTGRMAAAAVDATANRDEAVVSVNGAARVRVRRGAALVLIDPRGGIEAYPVEGARNLRVPFDMTIFPLFRVAGAVSCVDVGNAGWKDASTILARQMALRIDNYRPYETSAVFYLSADEAAAPTVTEVSGSGDQHIAVSTFRMDNAADRERLTAALAADSAPQTIGDTGIVSRVEITVRDLGDHRAIRLDLGVAPVKAMVRATVDLNNPKRATVCGIRPSP